MTKLLPYVLLIAAASLLGMFIWVLVLTSRSVSEGGTTVASLSAVSTRTANLERSLGLSETAWVDPLSIIKTQLTDRMNALEKSFDEFETIDRKELTDLEGIVNATRDTFLLHRDYHTLFSDETLLIIRALGMYESISWVDDQDSVIFKLGLQINLINDEKLSEVFVEVTLGEVSSEWLWMRLHYLLWTSLGGDY